MNGLTLAAAVKARVAAQITGRTVYAGAVPDGALPARYVVVWASEGSEESTRASDTVNVQTPALWVTCVSRNTNPDVAANESAWDAGRVRAALRNWRPEARWAITHRASAPAQREDATDTTKTTEQFSLRSSV